MCDSPPLREGLGNQGYLIGYQVVIWGKVTRYEVSVYPLSRFPPDINIYQPLAPPKIYLKWVKMDIGKKKVINNYQITFALLIKKICISQLYIVVLQL